MYRIIYRNDPNRVLLLGATSVAECEQFISQRKLKACEYLIQKVRTPNGGRANSLGRHVD